MNGATSTANEADNTSGSSRTRTDTPNNGGGNGNGTVSNEPEHSSSDFVWVPPSSFPIIKLEPMSTTSPSRPSSAAGTGTGMIGMGAGGMDLSYANFPFMMISQQLCEAHQVNGRLQEKNLRLMEELKEKEEIIKDRDAKVRSLEEKLKEKTQLISAMFNLKKLKVRVERMPTSPTTVDAEGQVGLGQQLAPATPAMASTSAGSTSTGNVPVVIKSTTGGSDTTMDTTQTITTNGPGPVGAAASSAAVAVRGPSTTSFLRQRLIAKKSRGRPRLRRNNVIVNRKFSQFFARGKNLATRMKKKLVQEKARTGTPPPPPPPPPPARATRSSSSLSTTAVEVVKIKSEKRPTSVQGSYRRKRCHANREDDEIRYLHVEDDDQEVPWKCSCDRIFKSRCALLAHMKKENQDWKFECNFCLRLFFCGTELKAHLRQVHNKTIPNGVYGCRSCGQWFQTKVAVIQHKKTNTGCNLINWKK